MQFVFSSLILLVLSLGIFAQNAKTSQNPEIFVADEMPAVVADLPASDKIRKQAIYITNAGELRKALGERSVFDLIDFTGGTEAAAAPYEQGKMLIVEFASPQESIAADAQIKQRLAETSSNPPIYYRRIGNYNTFVFDANSEAAANDLLEQVKYEKVVFWQDGGSSPEIRAERSYLLRTGEMFFANILAVVFGLLGALVIGALLGTAIFYYRRQKRAAATAFTDAGGMVRLNLDGLSPELSADRLLKE